MHNTLRLQSQAIALEAFSVKASLTAVTRLIPNFVKNINTFLSSALSSEAQHIDLVEGRPMLSQLKSTQYADLRGIQVAGPKGVKGTYLDYLKALEPSVAAAERLLPETLAPFGAWLAIQLANPAQLSSQRGQFAPSSKANKLEDIKGQVAAETNAGANQAEYLYGRVVKRNADWDEVLKGTNALVTRYLNTDRRKVLSHVQDIVQNLNTLIERIQANPDEYAMSGISAKTLAEHCYQIGLAVEYYSVTGYLVQAWSTGVQDTVDSLTTILRR